MAKKEGSPAATAAAKVSGSAGGLELVGEDVVFLDSNIDVAVGELPLTVNFTAEPFDPDEVSNPQYTWDFGDGTSANQPNVSHTYTKPGDYVATITLKDGSKHGSDSYDITVLPAKKK